jgi:Tfp pilus assembly protein PilP
MMHNAMERHAMRFRFVVIAALALWLATALVACNLLPKKGPSDAEKAQKAAEDKISEIRKTKTDQPPAATVAAPVAPVPGKKPEAKADVAAPAMDESAASAPSYDPLNKPDPFRPFRPEPEAAASSDNPLLKYEVRYFKLVGIVHDENPAAIFEDPTGKAYTLHQGQPIGKNGGVLRAIMDDGVIVSETRLSWRSEGTETVEMTIRLRPDEKKM